MPFVIEFSEDAERHLWPNDSSRSQHRLGRDRPTTDARTSRADSQSQAVATESTGGLAASVGNSRVLYNVDSVKVTVIVVAIGVKAHNVLTIDGKRYSL